MIAIHFQANYLPNHHEFNVRVKFGKQRLFEKMSIAKFLSFARQTERPLVIQGVTIKFEGDADGAANLQVRDYLKQVADRYVAVAYRNN